MKIGDLITTVFLAAVFCWGLAESAHWRWEVRALPVLASGFGIFLVMVLIALSARRAKPFIIKDVLPRADFFAIAGFLAGVTSVIIIGIFWGGLLLVFGHTYLTKGRSLKSAVIASVPMSIVPVLERGMHVQFFQGILGVPAPY